MDDAPTRACDESGLTYLESANVEIAGTPCEGMIIRAATGKVLGQLHAFAFDSMGTRLRYLVVRSTDLLARTRLVSLDAARVDIENNAIEVPAESYA